MQPGSSRPHKARKRAVRRKTGAAKPRKLPPRYPLCAAISRLKQVVVDWWSELRALKAKGNGTPGAVSSSTLRHAHAVRPTQEALCPACVCAQHARSCQ